jgi:hypothetical protein
VPPTSRRVPTITTTRNRLSITEDKKETFRPSFCQINQADSAFTAQNTGLGEKKPVLASYNRHTQPLAPPVPKMYIVMQ